jgi:hypothetical protein
MGLFSPAAHAESSTIATEPAGCMPPDDHALDVSGV